MSNKWELGDYMALFRAICLGFIGTIVVYGISLVVVSIYEGVHNCSAHIITITSLGVLTLTFALLWQFTECKKENK